ncbi:MAG: 1-acyl-sn-glycerol-3-phosphate acyltransferase [Acholeplasmatales bacterium]|jgi:1-acyl-sn-glycerol-3-phosphate acyltransferase|nr:1-acyl-sn-glycerol-3-phosphate acyltransferase [Acholeplasmatales bacterium]
MVTALFIIGWAAYSILMSIFITPNYLIPVWVVSGPIVGFVFAMFITLILIYTVIVPTKVTNKFKAYYTKSLCWFATHFLQGIRVTIHNKEYVKDLKQIIVYANHKSKADPQILLEVIKGPVGFTPKKNLYTAPFLGTYFKAIGCMCIDRTSDRETAKGLIKAIKDINSGMSMLVHPEGGICTREVEIMADQRPGAYKIAQKTMAPIVPVAILGSSKIHKYPALLYPKKVDVYILKPLLYEDYKDMSTIEISQYVYDTVNKQVESINGVKPIPADTKYYHQ